MCQRYAPLGLGSDHGGQIPVLRKEYWVSLQEHAAEVERLVYVAYGELPVGHQTCLMLVTFCSTLGHIPLQRHLFYCPILHPGRYHTSGEQTPTNKAMQQLVKKMDNYKPDPRGQPLGKTRHKARNSNAVSVVIEVIS